MILILLIAGIYGLVKIDGLIKKRHADYRYINKLENDLVLARIATGDTILVRMSHTDYKAVNNLLKDTIYRDRAILTKLFIETQERFEQED